jgi:hypothetical protein
VASGIFDCGGGDLILLRGEPGLESSNERVGSLVAAECAWSTGDPTVSGVNAAWLYLDMVRI